MSKRNTSSSIHMHLGTGYIHPIKLHSSYRGEDKESTYTGRSLIMIRHIQLTSREIPVIKQWLHLKFLNPDYPGRPTITWK